MSKLKKNYQNIHLKLNSKTNKKLVKFTFVLVLTKA